MVKLIVYRTRRLSELLYSPDTQNGLSTPILADKGVLLMRAGHPNEALSLLQQMEASDPVFRSSHEYLAQVYWDKGNCEESLAEYREEALLRGQDQAVKERHDLWLTSLEAAPEFLWLHRDPKFRQLVSDLGLPRCVDDATLIHLLGNCVLD